MTCSNRSASRTESCPVPQAQSRATDCPGAASASASARAPLIRSVGAPHTRPHGPKNDPGNTSSLSGPSDSRGRPEPTGAGPGRERHVPSERLEPAIRAVRRLPVFARGCLDRTDRLIEAEPRLSLPPPSSCPPNEVIRSLGSAPGPAPRRRRPELPTSIACVSSSGADLPDGRRPDNVRRRIPSGRD